MMILILCLVLTGCNEPEKEDIATVEKTVTRDPVIGEIVYYENPDFKKTDSGDYIAYEGNDETFIVVMRFPNSPTTVLDRVDTDIEELEDRDARITKNESYEVNGLKGSLIEMETEEFNATYVYLAEGKDIYCFQFLDYNESDVTSDDFYEMIESVEKIS